MTFLEDLSSCCCTTLVGTFFLMSDSTFAAVGATHFYTILHQHKEPVILLLLIVTFTQLKISVSLLLRLPTWLDSGWLALVALTPSQWFKSSCDY